MKNKITKKRTNIVEYILSELSAKESLLAKNGGSAIVVVKNNFYHNRLYIAVRAGESQIAHIILSRKKDYILKVVLHPVFSDGVELKLIRKYFMKNFPCKPGKFIVSISDIAYGEKHPNDILEQRNIS